MDGPKIVLFVTQNSYSYDTYTYFVFCLQTASSLAYAVVSRSAHENLLQAPLLSRSNSTEASLAKDNSSNDVKNGQGYMILLLTSYYFLWCFFVY